MIWTSARPTVTRRSNSTKIFLACKCTPQTLTRRVQVNSWGAMMGEVRHVRVVVGAMLVASCLSGMSAAPLAGAEPYGDTPADRQFLAEADQYLPRPRPTDVLVLKLGRHACQIRRSGGTSDDAKVAIWNTWNAAGIGPTSGAVVGSLVHVAVDNLCPEAGYP